MIQFSFASPVPKTLLSQDLKKMAHALGRVLRFRRLREVGVCFVTPTMIKQLNRRYRGINRPTDVLSFSHAAFSWESSAKRSSKLYLGDLIICSLYARKTVGPARLREELLRLLAHGVLHLVGFDHVKRTEERKMFALQERCVRAVMAHV